MELVWEALATKRRQLCPQDAPGGAFVTSICGGTWTAVAKWTAADCVAGEARGAAAVWCGTYKLNRMSSYSFARDGEQVACGLAREWCRRLQHFYDLWEMQPDAKHRFSEGELASYEGA